MPDPKPEDIEERNRVNRLAGLTPKNKMVFMDEDIFMVRTPHKIPNIWYRFWQRVLLGVKWQKL